MSPAFVSKQSAVPCSSLFRADRKPDLRALSMAMKEFTSELEPAAAADPACWPRLSIITPSFNQAEFLERTLKSVRNQGYPNLEHIVIDGGSTDGTLEILRKWDKSLTYWCSEQDGGQADAINKGLKLATGDWLAFQNSDDIYLPDALHSIGEAVRRSPGADVVYGHMLLIDGADNVTAAQLLAPPRLCWHVCLGMQLHNQVTFWRRSVMERVGLMHKDWRFCLDYDYFARVLALQPQAAAVDRFVGAFRLHPGAKTDLIAATGKSEHRQIASQYPTGPLPRPVWRAIARLQKAGWCLRSRKAWYLSHGILNF